MDNAVYNNENVWTEQTGEESHAALCVKTVCSTGFELIVDGAAATGVTCQDINECEVNSNACPASMTCVNTVRSFACGTDLNGITISSNVVGSENYNKAEQACADIGI